jgi:hypothetical protein
MYNTINEKVKVLAAFENGKILPKVFKWQNRDYKIKEIALYYTEKDGASINHCFGIETVDGGIFKIELNDKSLVWTLQEVWVD